MGEGHDHGASAVDVEGELRAPLRGLGAAFLVLGALALSGGLWLVTHSRTVSSARVRVDAALEALARISPRELAARAAAGAAADDAAAWWWAGEFARRAGDLELARAHFARSAELAPQREEPRRALLALEQGGEVPAWIDERAAAALESLRPADFPPDRR